MFGCLFQNPVKSLMFGKVGPFIGNGPDAAQGMLSRHQHSGLAADSHHRRVIASLCSHQCGATVATVHNKYKPDIEIQRFYECRWYRVIEPFNPAFSVYPQSDIMLNTALDSHQKQVPVHQDGGCNKTNRQAYTAVRTADGWSTFQSIRHSVSQICLGALPVLFSCIFVVRETARFTSGRVSGGISGADESAVNRSAGWELLRLPARPAVTFPHTAVTGSGNIEQSRTLFSETGPDYG